jgi:hypothetical protein
MTLYGREVRVPSLDGLERAKRAAGRIKDIADLAEILELRARRSWTLTRHLSAIVRRKLPIPFASSRVA